MKKSEIKFDISLDENHLPETINWEASDSGEPGKHDCKAVMLSMWDPKDSVTLRIDLWTKDMLVDDMKLFFHQTFVSMINTFERSTGEDKIVKQMREFSQYIAEEMNLLDKK
jgi:gliding motility-associated protein GldC